MTFRVVFDESSADFTEMDPADGDRAERIEAHLDELADALMEMRNRGMTVAVSPLGYGCSDCWPGIPFDSFLAEGRLPSDSGISQVDRDARVRCANLLHKCPEWDPGEPVDTDVMIYGRRLFAPSVAYAHAHEQQRSRAACLVFSGCARRGETPVGVADVIHSIRFIANAGDLPGFLRTFFFVENVPEEEFFALASEAFPMLVFCEKLNFSSFKGAYRNLREDVVTALSAINDVFPESMKKHSGQPDPIQQDLSFHGCTASRESPRTRSSNTLMKLRDVEFQGGKVRCEWHAKLAPQHNRIHFALLDDGRVLIGIFHRHLDIGK